MAQSMAEMLLERGIAQGIEQGARQNAIENIIAVLAARFPQSDVNAVKNDLEAIPSLDRLKEINLTASLTTNFEAFLQTLDT